MVWASVTTHICRIVGKQEEERNTFEQIEPRNFYLIWLNVQLNKFQYWYLTLINLAGLSTAAQERDKAEDVWSREYWTTHSRGGCTTYQVWFGWRQSVCVGSSVAVYIFKYFICSVYYPSLSQIEAYWMMQIKIQVLTKGWVYIQALLVTH